MRKYVYGLGAIVAPSLLGALLATGCGEDGGGLPGGDDICGPCGEIATGDIGISGDVRLDGFFKALGTVQNATAFIQADFEGNIRALGAVYGVELTGAINAAAIGQLTAAIEADIAANVEGGLAVVYEPPRCQASVNVSVQAQAKCEAKVGCDVTATPGELSVACEGTCSGSCSGSCSGDFSCEVEAPSITCEGQCEGSCTLEAGGECSGTCRGTCQGECSAQDAEGNCAGTCEGECTGNCELTVAAECTGSCTGKCLVNQGSASCTGEASCRGSCDAECSGGCEGNFTPPTVDADCEAAADCKASAQAEANASLECTPPQLSVDFTFNATAEGDLDAQAEFTARLSELKARGAAIIQGAAKYEALITGEVNGVAVFEPSPVVALRDSVTGFANANAIAQFDIPVGKLSCVVPAFQEAVAIAGSLVTDTRVTIEAQGAFVTAFAGGFGT